MTNYTEKIFYNASILVAPHWKTLQLILQTLPWPVFMLTLYFCKHQQFQGVAEGIKPWSPKLEADIRTITPSKWLTTDWKLSRTSKLVVITLVNSYKVKNLNQLYILCNKSRVMWYFFINKWPTINSISPYFTFFKCYVMVNVWILGMTINQRYFFSFSDT